MAATGHLAQSDDLSGGRSTRLVVVGKHRADARVSDLSGACGGHLLIVVAFIFHRGAESGGESLMADPCVISVNAVGKRFCATAPYSMYYGIQDVCRSIINLSSEPDRLRPHEF